MITVASTIRPKSIAPTDSRLADSPRSTMIPTAKNNANGMVAPTMIALRISAQEQPLQQDDQGDAEQHVVQHRVRGDVDQVLAVVDALDADARRQDARAVDPLDLRLTRSIVGVLCSSRRISTMPCTMSSSLSMPAMPRRG